MIATHGLARTLDQPPPDVILRQRITKHDPKRLEQSGKVFVWGVTSLGHECVEPRQKHGYDDGWAGCFHEDTTDAPFESQELVGGRRLIDFTLWEEVNPRTAIEQLDRPVNRSLVNAVSAERLQDLTAAKEGGEKTGDW